MFGDKLKAFIFRYQNPIKNVLRVLTFIFSLSAVGLFVSYYGFDHPSSTKALLLKVIKYHFTYFILEYIIRVLLSFHYRDFFANNWFETLLIFLIVVDSFFYFFLNTPLIKIILENNAIYHNAFYVLIIQAFLLLFVVLKLARLSRLITQLPVKPSVLFLGSFATLILIGTILLSFPEMTTSEGSMPLIDALFTATSATCVTGLIVVDTATYFTLKGQLVIMILMQAGGIGIITFALFFSLILRSSFGLKNQLAMKELMNTDSLSTAQSLLRQVISATVTIEGIGIFLIYFLWSPEVDFNSFGDRVYHSVFEGISAFCNAGFSSFTNGLYNEALRHSYLLHLVVATMIFWGGIGFPAIRDLTSISLLRERMRYPWKKWALSTRVAIYTSLTLIVFGMIMFFLLENNNTLASKNFMESIITAFFQSVTARTAGFNTVDISSVGLPMSILFIFLMFIGGSSASAAGGIKTSTFIIIFISVFSTIRGKRELEIGHHRISNELLHKAYSIFVFAASYILICVFLLSITESDLNIFNIVFEEVSAFCTVGLSKGITADLSNWGKLIISFSMFTGRVGILTLAVALSSMVTTTNYRYPSAHIMIG